MTSSEQRDKAIFLAFISGVSIPVMVVELSVSANEIEAIIRRELWSLKGKA